MSDEHGDARTDEALARAARRGDARAYDVLARRYLRPAMAIAWQFTRSLPDAEDVVQEAFHRMVRALGDYDERRPFSPWFYAIVRNQARSAAARDERRRALAPITSLETEPPERRGMSPELVGTVERAIAALAPMQQACVQLCDIEGFTSVEAATMLGIDEGTVRTHLHRARKQLRAAMA